MPLSRIVGRGMKSRQKRTLSQERKKSYNDYASGLANNYLCCKRDFTLGDHSFYVTAAYACNSLPACVIAQASLTTFKTQLKTFLFDKSFFHEYL